MRTRIDLPEPDTRALDQISKRRRVSRGAVIRQAVSDYLARRAAEDAHAAFGIWRGDALNGVEYQRGARSEW